MLFNGRAAAEGGARQQPHLAAGPPEISADGLTWTFRPKAGLHYAPPFEEREIVSEDVIQALERQERPMKGENGNIAPLGEFASMYDVIDGVQEFSAGKADHIAGLESPDARVLVVHPHRCPRPRRSRPARPTATTRTTGGSWSPPART